MKLAVLAVLIAGGMVMADVARAQGVTVNPGAGGGADFVGVMTGERGASGSCQPRTTEQCTKGANSCLRDKELGGRPGKAGKFGVMVDAAGRPYVGRTPNTFTTNQQDYSAADCGAGLDRCLKGC